MSRGNRIHNIMLGGYLSMFSTRKEFGPACSRDRLVAMRYGRMFFSINRSVM